ncbi:bacteriocin-like peptide, LSEI_2386 family [Lactobacillus amylovorus]
MKKQNVKKTVLKEEELTKVVGGSTAHVGFNFLT